MQSYAKIWLKAKKMLFLKLSEPVAWTDYKEIYYNIWDIEKPRTISVSD